MGAKRRTIYDDGHIRIVRVSSNGKREPAGIVIHMWREDMEDWSRALKVTIDELFDLTEILDDICDDIEDATYGVG